MPASQPFTAGTRERVAVIARAIEPVLKQVVLAGPPVVELLLTDPAAVGSAASFAADAVLTLLSTAMTDRLGIELQKRGFTRSARTADGDQWDLAGVGAVRLVHVQTEGDAADVWAEYATLLTLPIAIDEQLTVRIAGAPAVLALELAAFARRGRNAFASAELERIITLVVGRPELGRECAASPPELRTFISAELVLLLRNDGLAYAVERAIPDAAILPAIVDRVEERLRSAIC